MNSYDEILRVVKQFKEIARQNMEKSFSGMNFTGPQGMVAGMLTRFGEMKVSDLSHKMGLSNSTVSGILDRLELQEVVQRTRSTEDRRVVFVDLSPAFKEKFKDHLKSVDQSITNIMEQATPEEIEKIQIGFEALSTLLKRIESTNKKERNDV